MVKLRIWLLALLVAGTVCWGVGEPAGVAAAPRSGWNYTALGDSLATGASPFIASRSYVPRYRDAIQADTGSSVTLTNLGQNGWTSWDLLTALRTDRTFRRSVAAAQVVTWDIGGNDFRRARDSYRARTCGGRDNQACLAQTVTDFQNNWNGIVNELLGLRSTSTTIIRTMTVYNPYVTVDKNTDTVTGDAGNDFEVFLPYQQRMNETVRATAARDIPVADVASHFNGADGRTAAPSAWIAWDGLHPTDAGHAEIAKLLQALRYKPLSDK